MPLPWLTFVNVKTTASARRAALASHPIERLETPEDATLLVAGGRQTKGALPVTTPTADGAVYCSRGRGYAAYNEDGAGLFADEQGAVYASVFDQAGGLGGSVRGAASELAAKSAFRAFRDLATKTGQTDASQRLLQGIQEAHEALLERGEGEVTTAVLAVVTPGRAVVVNSGDSAAMHFNRAGQVRAMTAKHEVLSPFGVGCLLHGVGLTPEGPAPDVYDWTLESGDWLLMGSDGLLDAGLAVEAVGAQLTRSASPENAVNGLARQILQRMTLLRAKPDNLTIVAVKVR